MKDLRSKNEQYNKKLHDRIRSLTDEVGVLSEKVLDKHKGTANIVDELQVTIKSVKLDLQEAIEEKEKRQKNEKEREKQRWIECNRTNLCSMFSQVVPELEKFTIVMFGCLNI